MIADKFLMLKNKSPFFQYLVSENTGSISFRWIGSSAIWAIPGEVIAKFSGRNLFSIKISIILFL